MTFTPLYFLSVVRLMMMTLGKGVEEQGSNQCELPVPSVH